MSFRSCLTCFFVFEISLSVNLFPFFDFIEKVIISDVVDDMGIGLLYRKMVEKLEGKSFLSQMKNPLCRADANTWQGICSRSSVKVSVGAKVAVEEAFNTICWTCFGSHLNPFLESSFSELAALPSICLPFDICKIIYLTVSRVSVILSFLPTGPLPGWKCMPWLHFNVESCSSL